MDHSRSASRIALGALSLLGALALEGTARGTCAPPGANIVWTYPDETTASVPPDAVFWAVIDGGGRVTVAVDGIPLAPLGSGIDQLQYVPAEPFAPGPHELVVRAVRDGSYGLPPQTNERRLAFTVASDVPVAGVVNVDSVRFYPAFDGEERIDNPPVGRDMEDCSAQAVPLTPRCDDSGSFEGYQRVGYRAEGNPIAYVTGDTLFPANCTTLWSEALEPTDPGDFSVTTVLATGLEASRGYGGDIEIRNPAGSERSESACSLGGGKRSGSLAAPACALLGALLMLRRRAR
jgi:hypothetical protein